MPRQVQTAIITETLVADTTSYTALDTLRNDLGFAQSLKALRRRDIWLFRFSDVDREEALALTQSLARSTKLFVNPNKHRFEVSLFPVELSPQKPAEVEAGLFRFATVVRHQEDTRGDVALQALKGLYDRDVPVESIDVGILWYVDIVASGVVSAEETFRSMLLCNKGQNGLFVNPHAQVMSFPTIVA